MKVYGDKEKTKYVLSGSSATFKVDLLNLHLDVDLKATYDSNTYTTTEASPTGYKWVKSTSGGTVTYTLTVDKLEGVSNGEMTFATSRMTHKQYQPPKELGHSVTDKVTLDFFSKYTKP